jgi:GH15 family glucan-1,4-alpha-glucosidase
MEQFDFDKEMESHLAVLRSLQVESGLFVASAQDVKTGYDKAWLRDVFFMTLSFQTVGEWEPVQKAARALLGILCKHKDKIDWAIHNKPAKDWQFIHARYNPETFEEYWESWGNKQNDAVGEVLYLLSACESSGHSVVETDTERHMVQMLVDYLNNIEYWKSEDSGIWEEAHEVHASSIGACIAGLRRAGSLSYVTLPKGVIEKGEEALRKLLPRESEGKFCDLALLTLIYPFECTTGEERDKILSNIEYFNTRDKGVIRYRSDAYYNNNRDGTSEEAEWTMGLSWLAIIYAQLGNKEKAVMYLEKARDTITEEGLIPELYYSNTDKPNENTPLGWAESMYVIALHEVKSLG